MKKYLTVGILSVASLVAVSATCVVANKSPIISFAGTPENNYSVTFIQSSITDDTYCNNDNGTIYLSSKVNTTNDMLDLMVSYNIDGSSYHNQYGRILRYDVTSSWDGEFSIDCTLWSGISNFTSIVLNGSFTDILDEVSTTLTYVEGNTELALDFDAEENWTVHLSDSVFTIFDLTSITINYTC